MPTSLREVAVAAGVSLSTASRVFTNAATVSPEIRERVLAASEELRYRPRARVPRQETQALRNLIFLVRVHNRAGLAAMLGDFYGYVLQGVEAECRRQRVSMRFALDDDSLLESQLERLEPPGDSGILLVGPFTAADVATVQRFGYPLVLLNNVVEQPVDAVLPDYFLGAQLAVRHLLAAGHRRIAYLHGRDRYTTRLRQQGYETALREAGITPDPQWLVSSSMSPQAAREAVVELLRRDTGCTALFCVNDVSAYGALLALADEGLIPGADFSLVGFDDVDLSALTTTSLTTIHVPKLEMGALAVRRLQERAADADGPIQRVLLGVHLVARETVCVPTQATMRSRARAQETQARQQPSGGGAQPEGLDGLAVGASDLRNAIVRE
ncbi:LacI family transcriptional regulator [Candidatus Gracilibacteria bacterium]|nr:LacI family transcriptional regulator [Candidatus Gracilibacteria bacterium]